MGCGQLHVEESDQEAAALALFGVSVKMHPREGCVLSKGEMRMLEPRFANHGNLFTTLREYIVVDGTKCSKGCRLRDGAAASFPIDRLSKLLMDRGIE